MSSDYHKISIMIAGGIIMAIIFMSNSFPITIRILPFGVFLIAFGWAIPQQLKLTFGNKGDE